MPQDLYVYLRDGSDALLVAVTATPTLVDKSVKSAPYRDLGHRGLTGTGDPGLDVVKLDGHGNTSVDGVVFDSSNNDGLTVGSINTHGITQSVPDNVSHVPPRQTTLSVTCYIFACSDGIEKWFQFDDVIGWGPNPRN